MSFYELYLKYKSIDIYNFEKSISDNDILRAISKERLGYTDFLCLLTEKAEKYIENMAKKAHQLTIQHFGKVIFIYTPMYIANFCVNQCVYCTFNSINKIMRKKLNIAEVEEEAKNISSKGIKHILILTGESRKHSSVLYIKDCVKVLKKYFCSISIETYPLETDEYKELIDEGVDGLTIYQEVYNEEVYKAIHLKGPKTNYIYRVDAPERAAKASIRSINVGALLGLDDFRREIFFTGIHAEYLQSKYTEIELGLSLPRIRPNMGCFVPKYNVSDKNMVQAMLALRLFMPRAGITISTREKAEFRDNLIGIGVTKMSADSSTKVGGHTSKDVGEGQFEISDSRNIKEIKNVILNKGYEPVFKDWQAI